MVEVRECFVNKGICGAVGVRANATSGAISSVCLTQTHSSWVWLNTYIRVLYTVTIKSLIGATLICL